MYRPIHKQGSLIRRVVRTLTLFPYLRDCNRKYRLFEEFLNKYMVLTPCEYTSLSDIERDCPSFDYYITGSDQIWNTGAYDFDWVYFLPFVKHGRRIAYAPSMGCMHDAIEDKYISKMKEYLQKYDSISVRERGTALKLLKVIPDSLDIVLDPTLLLGSEYWNSFVDKRKIVEGDYLFLYSPVFNLDTFDMTREIANRLGLKVVISQLYGREITYKYPEFKVCAACGPKEFLNLTKNASLVCGNSFHLTVFSILLKTPFLLINGMNDNRIEDLLRKTNLENRAITKNNFEDCIKNVYSIDFESACLKIDVEKNKSISFLRKALF